MSLYKRQREQIKNDIVALSINMFREFGYENVTIEQITKRMEIAKGTFYNYFRSKRDILMYWSQERFAGMDISFVINKERDCETNLKQLLETFIDAIQEENRLFRSFILELDKMQGGENPEYQGFAFTILMKEVVIHSFDGIKISKNYFEVKMQVLTSAIFYEVKSWIINRKDITKLKDHIHKVLKICLYGLYEGEEKV
jgi:AcrR family transcriptional regulator